MVKGLRRSDGCLRGWERSSFGLASTPQNIYLISIIKPSYPYKTKLPL